MKKLLLFIFLSCSFCLFGQTIDTFSIHRAIERQMTAYPESTLQDIYKSFYQDHFGPEHLIGDTASVRTYLMRELSEMTNTSMVYFEPTGSEGRFVRVYLSTIADSLIAAEQLFEAFVRSADRSLLPSTDWETKWNQIVSVIMNCGFEVNGIESDTALLREASRNHQAIHHSRAYNAAYHPHYRIVEHDIFERELKPFIQSHIGL